MPAPRPTPCSVWFPGTGRSPSVGAPPESVPSRAELFGRRGGHYYEHWDQIYAEWKDKVTRHLEEIKAIHEGAASPVWDGKLLDRACLAAVDEQLDTANISDATWATLSKMSSSMSMRPTRRMRND